MLRASRSTQKKAFAGCRPVALILVLHIAFLGPQGAWGEHIDISWNSGENIEDWSDAGNWSPNQVPGIFNTVLIGDLPIADNAFVQLDVDTSIGALTITDGMKLRTNGFTMNVEGNTIVAESNASVIGQTRLEIDNGVAAVDFGTTGLNVTDTSAVVLSNGGWLTATGRVTVDDDASIRGDGVIYLEKDGPILSAFSLNGHMRVESGVMEIFQAGTSLIDLDGSGDTGTIRIVSSATAPNVLIVSGTELNDTFDGEIDIRARGRLNMNLANGWTVGESGRVLLRGTSGNQAVVEGSDLDFRGELRVHDGRIESNVIFQNTATVEFIGDSRLFLEGETTFAGANFYEFDGPSDPLIRQNGDLTVTEDTTLNIPSGRFDWDGEFDSTITTIEPGTDFTINARAIDTGEGTGDGTTGGNYNSETNVGDGGRLIVNTAAAWRNSGVIRLEEATLEGSAIVNNDLIQGSGSVSPAGINNRGTLRSFGGGVLAIGPDPSETGVVIVPPVPVDGIDALENGVINYGFDLDGVDEDGVLVATDGSLRINAFQGNFVFDGTLNIGFGYEYLMNTGGLHNRGTITITGGGEYRGDLIQSGQLIVSLGVLDDAVIVSDDATFSSTGTNTLLADLYLQGNVAIQEGAQFDGDSSLINMLDSVLVAENGALLDITLENLGLLDLDTNAARVEVAAFMNAITGTLAIDLSSDGGLPGFDQDRLVVGGLAELLGGTLTVDLLGGFIPTSGDEFLVVTAAGGVSGTFDAYDFPTLTGDDEWFVRYEANEVVLLVTSVPVPEPSTLLLAVLATLGLGRSRKVASS